MVRACSKPGSCKMIQNGKTVPTSALKSVKLTSSTSKRWVLMIKLPMKWRQSSLLLLTLNIITHLLVDGQTNFREPDHLRPYYQSSTFLSNAADKSKSIYYLAPSPLLLAKILATEKCKHKANQSEKKILKFKII